jgi:small subunit ribosomal protein S19
MSRSKWKGFFINNSLINPKKSKINTWSRSSVISEALLGKKVNVYNGKVFKQINITREKLGYKLGEFSFTRIVKERVKKNKKIKIKKNKKK